MSWSELRYCYCQRLVFQLLTVAECCQRFPRRTIITLYHKAVGSIGVLVGDIEGQGLCCCIVCGCQRRLLHAGCPPDRFLGIGGVVGEGGTMVAIDFPCRCQTLAGIGLIIHICLPHISTIDGIAFNPRALVDFLQQSLQILAIIIVTADFIAVPRCRDFHLGEPYGTVSVVVDGLALRVAEPIGIAVSSASAQIPIGMSNGEVTTCLVIVLVNVFEVIGQITEIRWLWRTYASASCTEILCKAVCCPFIQCSATAAFVTRMLLGVIWLVYRESCCIGVVVDIARTWPITVLTTGNIFHVRC